jgi:anti-sigma regulatory factor (Ser/Thr protein kinase)
MTPLRLAPSSGKPDDIKVPYDEELCLPEDYRSVALARDFVRRKLTGTAYQGRHDDVVLVVSELVANALLHGHGTPMLRLTGTAQQVRIEVTDDSPALPAVRTHGPVGGWGLKLVQRLAAGWGTAHRDHGKVVWCELVSVPTPAAARPQAAAA